MSIGSPVAADVPSLFDVIINGQGYLYLRTIDTSLPFRTQRALYGRSATFVERSNVSGDYGDDQQDFWLTAAQRDWSLGEDQKFFRSTVADSERMFWQGTDINASIQGQVTIARSQSTTTLGASATAVGTGISGAIFVATTTNLYEIDNTGSITNHGAHGAGGAPDTIATDGIYVYLSGGACTSVRSYTGGVFATFSAQPANSLVFMNNSLYGVYNTTLYAYSTAGVATAAFTWKLANGATWGGAPFQLAVFGGQIIILQSSVMSRGPMLWVYDGAGVKQVAEFPVTFRADTLCVVSGIVFVGGSEFKTSDGQRPAIYYYSGSSSGRAWANPAYTSTVAYVAVTPFGEGLLFNDFVLNSIRYYDLSAGGIISTATYVDTGGANQMAASSTGNAMLVLKNSADTVYMSVNARATSGTVISSIFDFESSLKKLFRGVIVSYVTDTSGDHGSVDVYYQLDSVDGAYTLLQAGATSGTEVLFPSNTTATGVSVKVVLNKGTTSGGGPVLKRLYVRAAPVLQAYRKCEYMIDCSSRDGRTPLILNDNETAHPLDGLAQATNLNTVFSGTAPFTITDRFGTYTGIFEDTTHFIEVSPEEYIARLFVRQV